MKKDFELEIFFGENPNHAGVIKIDGDQENTDVIIEIPNNETFFMKQEELELFAVNILKALGSKRLNP